MLSPEQRERLAKLNRELARKLTTADAVTRVPAAARPARPPRTLCTSLGEAIPGTVCDTDAGHYYLIRRNVADFYHDEGELRTRLHRIFRGAGLAVSPDELHEQVRPLVEARPENVFFLDIETCGFTGLPLFLVGLMNYEGGELVVRQLLARNYAEERPLLVGLWQTLRPAEALVTFNGKSFDMPMIFDRSIVHGLFEPAAPAAHIDLLHEARRRWKKELPNCRLQTLEQLVCNRYRGNDIPSSEIPAVYHEFVRTAEAGPPERRDWCLRQLRSVIHHNALDLVTMAELVARILA